MNPPDFTDTPSEELARLLRQSINAGDDSPEARIGSSATYDLLKRGGLPEFQIGERYVRSADPLDREAGARILGQLGYGADRFHEESVTLLLGLLTDPEAAVISAAAFALGHRRSARAIPAVLPLISHPDPDVRWGAVHALTGQEDPAAVAGLISLMADPVRDVRDWATFGLGSITEADSPEIRDAFARLLDEPDAEIRGEALIGLARRGDPRVDAPLIRELTGEFHGSWCLEAAELLGLATLHPLLLDLRSRVNAKNAAAFVDDFERALVACSGLRPPGRMSPSLATPP